MISSETSEEALAALPEAARRWAGTSGFAGKLGQIALIPSEDGGVSEALFGWGDAEARAKRRFALADFASKAPDGVYRIVDGLAAKDADEAALGWLLGGYRFDRYKSASAQGANLIAPEGVDPGRVTAMAEGAALARDLINTPASDMGPDELEAAARTLAEHHGAEVSVVLGEELLDQNFPMIHTVGRAATRAPRLIDMTWGAEDAPKVTLIGKGVCFDTGGLDLKTAAGMRMMKKDMGGAANVLALASMIMARALKVRLRVLIPAVENSVSGNAFRPGDVLTSRKGLTVEIGNTDAEGRLVLADAMALASEETPEIMIDMATLTGAARVAMGTELAPVFCNDDALSDGILAGGAAVRDPVWRMPLYDPYDDDLKSPIADLDNAPGGGYGGAITAALFLRRFVGEGIPWAHFDLMAWNLASKPGRPKGGECMAARACFAMLEARFG
ncbi:MAG: leucyl aminopeptidase family protein [Pseudomonadota bacterium]